MATSQQPQQGQSQQNQSQSKSRSGISAIDISQALKGADFPANRDELVQQAQQNSAQQEVISVIQNLPSNQQFNNMADVERACVEEKRAAS